MESQKVIHPGLVDIAPAEVIDKNSPIPLHYQLERFLREGIESGRFPPKQSLPTEQELQDFFNLSRTPIRQAISKLVAGGLVERKRSLGTVVLPQPFEENLSSLSSFTEEVIGKGHQPRTRVIEFTIKQASADDQAKLNVPAKAEIYHVRRVRYIDGEPVGLVVSHLPVALLPELDPTVFTIEGLRQSIYYVLETVFGLKLVRAVEVISAVNLDDEEAAMMSLPYGTPVLLRNRVTYDSEDRAVAWERALYHVRYQLEWNGREVKNFDRSLARA